MHNKLGEEEKKKKRALNKTIYILYITNCLNTLNVSKASRDLKLMPCLLAKVQRPQTWDSAI